MLQHDDMLLLPRDDDVIWMITVPPEKMTIMDIGRGSEVRDSLQGVIGPFDEGSALVLLCEVVGGMLLFLVVSFNSCYTVIHVLSFVTVVASSSFKSSLYCEDRLVSLPVFFAFFLSILHSFIPRRCLFFFFAFLALVFQQYIHSTVYLDYKAISCVPSLIFSAAVSVLFSSPLFSSRLHSLPVS